MNSCAGYGSVLLTLCRSYADCLCLQVSKWYNLVIFTASVQEYADPVIDWLESERKFFSGRFYRQHCTFRQNAFIKDLSSVEPDLSKVMILDNSPLSYMFHQGMHARSVEARAWTNDRVKIMRFPSKAGSTIPPIMTSFILCPFSRACSMCRTCGRYWHCAAERTGSTWHDMTYRYGQMLGTCP
jgi:hypothetical protein